MFTEKFLETLTSPPDGAMSIVTQGIDGPHVVNSWNSYACLMEDGKIALPGGRMIETEKNLARDNRVYLTVTNRNVQGKSYVGTGFLLKGTAEFLKEGAAFDLVKAKFPWARGALTVTVHSMEQTL
jgi:hypothetical protein